MATTLRALQAGRAHGHVHVHGNENENLVPLFFGEPSGQQRRRIAPHGLPDAPLRDLTHLAYNVMNVTELQRPSPIRWRLHEGRPLASPVSTPHRATKVSAIATEVCAVNVDSSTVLLRKGFR